MKMEYAVHKKIIQGKLCRFWLNSDGVLCIEANDNIITTVLLKHDYLLIVNELGGRKVCIFYDASKLQPIEKKIRLMLENMLGEVGVGLAISTKSRVGKAIASIFLALATTRIPIKIHDDPSSAFAWLKGISISYLEKA